MDLPARPAVLETVHSQLRELLGELGDTGPAGGPAPGSWRPRPGT